MMPTHITYRLCKGVQVRKEKFGLLFYNYAGPKIYFVPSQDLVDESYFSGGQSLSNLIHDLAKRREWPVESAAEQLSTFFRQLEAKGLVHEQSVC